MTGLEGDHVWDVRVHADGTPFTEAEVAELEEEMRTLREFLDRRDATPPEERRLMSDKFSGPVAMPGGGYTHEPEDEPGD